MKNREKDIYTAGLMDGEGTITLTRLHSNTRRAPVISLSSTSEELMDFFHRTYGGAVISKKTYSARHTRSWECRLTYNAAIGFLGRVLPYLRHREKRRRARLLLTSYRKLTPRNGKYTAAMERKKREFERRFFHPSTP